MKTLLIFGGSGSLGHTLIKKYISTHTIIIFSRDENKHWLMRQTFKNFSNIFWCLGDIRNKDSVEIALYKYKPNIVIMASALKHIDQCEYNISECIDTNIIGTKNIIDCIFLNAIKGQMSFLEKVLFISTDKACSPVNSYGMCKSLSERIVIEKSEFIDSPKFIVVRYGNVLNSRGSLLPLYKEIATNDDYKFFNVTHDKMTRFFMTLDESVELIENALNKGESGDTYIPNVKSYKIYDIAELFSKKYNKPINISGLRPGEKMFEVLINITEISRTIKEENNFIIKPCYKNIKADYLKEEFTSDNSLEDVSKLLKYV